MSLDYFLGNTDICCGIQLTEMNTLKIVEMINSSKRKFRAQLPLTILNNTVATSYVSEPYYQTGPKVETQHKPPCPSQQGKYLL